MQENKTFCLVSLEDLRCFFQEVIAQCPQSANNNEIKEEFLTAKEVQERLKISRSTLWRWNEREYLCPVKVGMKKNMYKLSDIMRISENE